MNPGLHPTLPEVCIKLLPKDLHCDAQIRNTPSPSFHRLPRYQSHRPLLSMQVSQRKKEILCGLLSAAALGVRGKVKGFIASLLLLYFVKQVTARAKPEAKGKPAKLPLWCSSPVSPWYRGGNFVIPVPRVPKLWAVTLVVQFVPLVVAAGFWSRGQKVLSIAAIIPAWLCCLPDRFELPSADFIVEQLEKDSVDQGAVLSKR